MQHLRDWKPKLEERSVNIQDGGQASQSESAKASENSQESRDPLDTPETVGEAMDTAVPEVSAAA